jgi:hypothetical protein
LCIAYTLTVFGGIRRTSDLVKFGSRISMSLVSQSGSATVRNLLFFVSLFGRISQASSVDHDFVDKTVVSLPSHF